MVDSFHNAIKNENTFKISIHPYFNGYSIYVFIVLFIASKIFLSDTVEVFNVSDVKDTTSLDDDLNFSIKRNVVVNNVRSTDNFYGNFKNL